MNGGSPVLRRGLVAALVWLGLGFTLHAMPVWMTPDSVEYVAMAESLADGRGVQGLDGEPAGLWGPGFPALLAPGLALGIDVFDLVPWLHATIWTLLLLFVVVPLVRQLGAGPWRWPLLVGALVGAPVITVTTSLLADATLVAGVLAGTFLAERVRRGARAGGLIALVALLPLVKIVGIAVWPAVVWSVWNRGRSRWWAIAAMVAPLTAWSIRNLAHFGLIAERFPGGPRPLGETLRRTAVQSVHWFVPRVDSTDVLLLSGAVLLVVLIVVWYRLGRPSLPGAQTPWLLSAGSFLLLFLVGSATRKVDFPDHRLLAPLFVLGLVLASRWGAAMQPRGGVPIAALGLAWAALIGVQGVTATRVHLLGPQAPLFDREDRLSAIVESSVRDLEGDAPVWSNVPELVYWHTGQRAQWTEPRRLVGGFGEPGTAVRVVWFAFSARDGLVHPRDFDGVRWREPLVREGIELWRGTVRPAAPGQDEAPAS